MALARSASVSRAARVGAVVVVLLALAGLAGPVSAAPINPPSTPALAVSLEQSAAALPLSGTMGFTGVIRFTHPASSVRARLQVHLPSGRLIFQRTQYLDSAEKGTRTFAFSRPLEGLGLDAGEYPATFSVLAHIEGSDIATQVTVPVRIYDTSKPPITVVVVAKIHSRPMSGPGGKFDIDPALVTRARDEVDRVATMVAGDPRSRLMLAIPPVTLEEWRRIATNGYTLASGTVVPPSDPTAVAYGTALANLHQAIGTGRLELVTMGYADPHLADLSLNHLSADGAVQYDAGLSAVFASMQTTPSAGTVPDGGSVPKPMQAALAKRGVRYAVSEPEGTRVGKRPVPSGAYPVGKTKLTALVIDAPASRGLEAGDASATVSRSFGRLGKPLANQPMTVRIDLDDAVSDATATVGLALTTVESTPWMRLALGKDVRAPKGAKRVAFVPIATRNAPKGFWTQVRRARADAGGLLAVLGEGNAQATAAQSNSLLAESSYWSAPAARWKGAPSGLAYADAAVASAETLFDKIKISAESVTLAGATGKVPVNIQNGSKQTLNVVLLCKTGGGVRVVGQHLIPTTLAPRETFVEIPIDMGPTLHGKLTVQVMAGDVIVTTETIDVRRSYLDRLAFIGGIVVLLGGMLVWIVMRVRKSPDIDDADEAFERGAASGPERYTGSGSDGAEGPGTP